MPIDRHPRDATVRALQTRRLKQVARSAAAAAGAMWISRLLSPRGIRLDQPLVVDVVATAIDDILLAGRAGSARKRYVWARDHGYGVLESLVRGVRRRRTLSTRGEDLS